MAVRNVRGNDHELLFVELGDGEVRFQLSRLVEPLGVGDLACLGVDFIGRDVIQEDTGIAALYQEFSHEGHVHQDHVLAAGAVLLFPPGEPVRPAPGQAVGHGLMPFRRIPARRFPSADVPEMSACFRQPVVERGFARPARGHWLAVGIVAGIYQAE